MKELVTTAWVAFSASGLVLAYLSAVFRQFPTLNDFLRLVLSNRLGRFVLLFGWLWLGWHLFVGT